MRTSCAVAKPASVLDPKLLEEFGLVLSEEYDRKKERMRARYRRNPELRRRRVEYTRNWRRKNRERYNRQNREWASSPEQRRRRKLRRASPEYRAKARAWNKAYRLRHRARLNRHAREVYADNPGKYAARIKAYRKKGCKKLTDTYIKRLIINRFRKASIVIRVKDIPGTVIAAKRLSVKIKRKLKEKKELL